MSRIGKAPIQLPQGVKVSVSGAKVNVEGPKGKLHYDARSELKVVVDANLVKVELVKDTPEARAIWGATRAHLNNMVTGVSTGWKRGLELNGVGYVAKVQGPKLVLSVGFSHDVEMTIPQGVKCTVNKNQLEMEGVDREVLGTFAAKVRKVQPPEPYLGKGIKYVEETIRRKAGKTGKK